MNLNDLREKQAQYIENNLSGLHKKFEELENKRLKFIKVFPINQLTELTLESYVVGGGRKNSFCYWLETTLMGLGKIKGGSTAGNKFGVYFGRTNNDNEDKFRFIPKWGDSVETAFYKIRSEIIALVNAGEIKDIDSINRNMLSPMFKGKILSTYFPNIYLSIYSDEHLNHYINIFNLSFENYKNLTPVEKRFLLIEKLKNSDEIMKDWSLHDFAFFLWTQFTPPRKESLINFPKELLPYKSAVYPDLFDVNPQIIEVKLQNIPDKKSIKKTSPLTKFKPDYEKRNFNNRIQGSKAEAYVLKIEKEFLSKIGRNDLESKVEQVSSNNDALGYDILSFDELGNEKQIEVKSNASILRDKITFIISENEYIKAQEIPNYWIYYVTELTTVSPKIVKIKIGDQLEKMELIPSQYKATFYISQI